MSFNNRWLILGIVSCALLLIVVDMSVLYIALPRLTHDLSASASAKLWIINIYTLVVSGLLLGAGTLGDRLGHKRLFVAGLGVFAIASLCAAYSPTPDALIAARALLAVGAAMMMPSTLSIIRITFTNEHERAMAIGIWGAVASGGAALGPVVGGVLLEYFWWGSVFLINVPIILMAMPLAVMFIPHTPGDATKRWDFMGSLQVMVGLIGLAYAVKELGKQHPAYMIALATFMVGVIFLVVFTKRQRRSPHPLIDFAIFRNPVFSGAVASALIAMAALSGMELVFSQRLQLVLGLSPLQAGLFILPLPVAAFIAGPCTGFLLPRLGALKLLFSGLLLAGLGMLAYLVLHNAPAIPQIICLVALGSGVGVTMTAASSTIMHSAPASQAGMVASIEEVSYELGGAIGVTLMGSIMSAVYAASLVVPAELQLSAVVYDSLDEALRVAEHLPPEASGVLSALSRTAFDNAFITVLAVACVMLMATAIAVWQAARRSTNEAAAATNT